LLFKIGKWKPPQHIRPTVQAVVVRDGQVLVFEEQDSVKNEFFYRPIGGGIEFLESGADAVVREFKEETNLDVMSPTLLGVLENIFVYEGTNGHEIVQVYKVEFKDPELYKQNSFKVVEGKIEKSSAVWKDISFLIEEGVRFYPDGMKAIVAELMKI
jgi:ADP-ribose pyrophosphatase YjhB (NUDIX family)